MSCVYVAEVIPLTHALWLGAAGMVGIGLVSFALGAWWRGGS